MGAYFLVVNPAKRQYLDPGRFGEDIKFCSVLRGDHCIEALKLLVSDRFRRCESSFPGAWLGDPVILASDSSGLPDPGNVRTATSEDPQRNLHAIAKADFTDISYRAIAELCKDAEIAAELANRAMKDDCLMIDLGATMQQYHLPELESALETAVGGPWGELLRHCQAKCSWWEPLPAIDWPLSAEPSAAPDRGGYVV